MGAPHWHNTFFGQRAPSLSRHPLRDGGDPRPRPHFQRLAFILTVSHTLWIPYHESVSLMMCAHNTFTLNDHALGGATSGATSVASSTSGAGCNGPPRMMRGAPA